MMKIPKLQIQTTPARIGLNTQEPVQTIRQNKATQSIQQPEADMEIRQRPGTLTIDQTNAWHNLDLKSVFVRSEELVDIAYNLWLEGIARVSREGDELMRVENKGNPIASQAERNTGFDFSFQPGGKPINDLVAINYQPHEVWIDIQRRHPIIETTKKDPELNYRPGNVSFTMDQMPELEIDWKV